MQIHISGHHVDLTQGIVNAVNEQFSKIADHFPNIQSLDVVLTVERNEHRCNVSARHGGKSFNAKGTAGDLYVAIGEAEKRLMAALDHRRAPRQRQPRLVMEEPEIA